MNAGKKAKPDAAPSRLLLALHGRVIRYMASAGLIAFAAEPGAGAAGAGAAGSDAGGAGAAGSDGKPAGSDAGGAGADGKPAAGADGKPAAGADGKPAVGADGKPADGADGKPAADGKDPKDGDGKPTGAPEAYEPFKLPEGMEPDPALTAEFSALAKSLNLTQEQAQQLADFDVKRQQGGVAALEAQSQKWASDAQADKEFGGDKFAENLAISKKAMEKFAAPEFRAFLEKTKLGNHPEMLRAWFRVGQAISEDGFTTGRAGSGDKSVAQRMYPNMNP